MKLTTLKTASEVKLPGIRVEFVKEDNKLIEVILKAEGSEESYSVRPGESYTNSLKLHRRDSYEMKTIHRLEGTVLGFKVRHDFDSQEDAEARAEELRYKDNDATVAVFQVDIRVDDSGVQVPSIDTDIPF